MKGNAITDKGCVALSKLLLWHSCSIPELCIGANMIGPTGALHVCEPTKLSLRFIWRGIILETRRRPPSVKFWRSSRVAPPASSICMLTTAISGRKFPSDCQMPCGTKWPLKVRKIYEMFILILVVDWSCI